MARDRHDKEILRAGRLQLVRMGYVGKQSGIVDRLARQPIQYRLDPRLGGLV